MRSAGATQSTFINECNEEDIGDRAPLLNTASSVPTWLSSGQLPYRESTWLGYGKICTFLISGFVFLYLLFECYSSLKLLLYVLLKILIPKF